jgi:hypothetical protein
VGQLASDDHPGALSPRRQVHQVGDLGDLAGLALVGAMGRDGLLPALFGDFGHDGRHLGAEFVADDEADAALLAGLGELVRATRRVGPGDHLAVLRIDRQLGQGVVEHDDVIICVARRRVARAQSCGQWLTGRVEEGYEWGEPEPVLVIGAAPSFSECAPTNVASRSIT